MKYIKQIIFIALIFLFSSCATPINTTDIDKPGNNNIGKLQSELVTLTIECNKGIQKSCDKIPEKKEKLQNLLNQ